MARGKHIDHILGKWPYDPTTVKVRICQGADSREVLQMRLDMGILQLEMEGRPDGAQPNGYETYFDYLIGLAIGAGIRSDSTSSSVSRLTANSSSSTTAVSAGSNCSRFARRSKTPIIRSP